MRSALAMVALVASPAMAEVTQSEPGGFVSTHRLVIAAPPEQVWDTLIVPSSWWSGEHSYSGDSANITLDLRPGGCWCEKTRGGAVEHARVLYIDRARALRLSGAFGPLQSGAVTGTMTFTLTAQGAGTALTLTYVVGGYNPGGLAGFATAVDGVLGAQMPALKARAEAR